VLISRNGAQHDLAGRLPLLLADQLRLENVQSRFHGGGTLDQLGKEVSAVGEELADLLDALHQAFVDALQRVGALLEGLPDQRLGFFRLAVYHGLAQLREEFFRHLRLLLDRFFSLPAIPSPTDRAGGQLVAPACAHSIDS
jgi:hypothetical protein